MIKVDVKTEKALDVFCVEGTAPNLGGLIEQLMVWAEGKGAVTASPLIAVFHSNPNEASPDKIKCWACIALASPPGKTVSLKPEGPVQVKKLPETPVAFTLYEGPQSATKEVSLIFEILRWMEQNGYKQAAPARQLYKRFWMEGDVLFTEMETQIPVSKT